METPQKDQSNGEDNKGNINIDIHGDQDDAAKNNTTINTMDTTNSEQRVGLTKDELMKYANQPFWVRLRNILFASFWIFWVSILMYAIGSVVRSPNCNSHLVSASNVASTPATASSAIPDAFKSNNS